MNAAASNKAITDKLVQPLSMLLQQGKPVMTYNLVFTEVLAKTAITIPPQKTANEFPIKENEKSALPKLLSWLEDMAHDGNKEDFSPPELQALLAPILEWINHRQEGLMPKLGQDIEPLPLKKEIMMKLNEVLPLLKEWDGRSEPVALLKKVMIKWKETETLGPDFQASKKTELALIQENKTAKVHENRLGHVLPIRFIQSEKPKAHSVLPASSVHSAMHPIEQFVVHLPELKGNDDGQQRVVKEFQHIFQSSNFKRIENGVMKMNIRLTPDHLGTLNIEVLSKHGEITARIVTSNASAKEVLESHLHLLKSAFHGNSIAVERIIISDQPQTPSFNDQGGNAQTSQEQRHREQHSKQKDNDPINHFDEIMEEMGKEV